VSVPSPLEQRIFPTCPVVIHSSWRPRVSKVSMLKSKRRQQKQENADSETDGTLLPCRNQFQNNEFFSKKCVIINSMSSSQRSVSLLTLSHISITNLKCLQTSSLFLGGDCKSQTLAMSARPIVIAVASFSHF
jgi:hypothetical protein